MMRTFCCGSRGVFVALLAGLAFVVSASAQVDAEKGRPETPTPAGTSKPAEPAETIADPAIRRKAVDRLIEHYVEMYGKHLKSRDWMARAMAVIGLSPIDDPRTTEMLFEVMDADTLPLVRVYAWEALHSRLGSLDEDQRQRWVQAGRTLLGKDQLRGDLRVGLVRAVAAAGPTDENHQLFRHLFQKTNSMDSSDIRTLEAMRDVLGQWRDRRLIADLIGVMENLDCVFRAEFVLRGLPWSVPMATSFSKEGTEVLCRKVQTSWREALEGADEDWFEPVAMEAYDGPSEIMPAAEQIADPGDPRWRKALELTRFTLDHLDVALAVDSTGSMMPVVRWIQRDVTKLMRAFCLISYEPRLSIIFYRDHGDAYVVKPFPFTSNAGLLSRAIGGIKAKGGGDEPEAVYEALGTALTKQKWSSGHYARRIVVIVGDAPPHQSTMGDIEKMVTAAAKQNFRFFCLKVRSKYTAGDVSALDRIAEWGKGRSLWADFQGEFPELEYADMAGRDPRVTKVMAWEPPSHFGQVAGPAPRDGPYRQLVREIVRTAIPKAYRDKTEPFVDTLLEYLETYVPEKRQPFAPWEEEKRGPGPGRRKREKPFDPQER